ncbi:MAG: thrombospondin type 3 repeat-containing protein [Myxococcota bacterium]
MNAIRFGWCLSAVLALALAAPAARAQNAECAGGACGTPNQSGGGGCGCGGGSILINNTDLGDTYQYADDFDDDGWEDDFDNCPFSPNAEQGDLDGDGFGDNCDNCRSSSNPLQSNADGDLDGDGCDVDADNDGLDNTLDNCDLFPNPAQVNGGDDVDGDGQGNMCDDDDDADGVLDTVDNCPLVNNPGQDPTDRTTFGAACAQDEDQDGTPDNFDNCPNLASLDKADKDLDGIGDVCDADLDNDGVPNISDNCRLDRNPTQVDGDRDGLGDGCDSKFCFTVDSPASDRCLDPDGPFHSRPGPDITIKTGETVRLRLFANRSETAIKYTWGMEKAPEGSRNWAIKNPRGSVTHSTPWEYHYQTNRVSTFMSNEPGEFVIRLESELVFDDVKGYPKRNDVKTMTIKVEGDPILLPPNPLTMGCSSSTNTAPVLTVLGLMALAVRRRRR